MGFHVKYDDVTAFGFYADGRIAEWGGQLQGLSAAFGRILAMDSFRGEAAAGAKNYIAQVHMTAIASILEALNEYGARFLLYKDGYYSIDDGLSAGTAF
ncbi:MAG: LXG domain-containing protein [Clostridiales Family XIII bacterium]|jgi:hypothetical protein|nr:LXG domain-containing protein [Clostridiales Family XIII bacterium]